MASLSGEKTLAELGRGDWLVGGPFRPRTPQFHLNDPAAHRIEARLDAVPGMPTRPAPGVAEGEFI